ncbi:MAG: hypothetical protein AAB838_03105 [Patescibacteria group bacterium]
MDANERLLHLIGGTEHVLNVKRNAITRGVNPMTAAEKNAAIGDEVMTARCLAAAGSYDEETITRLLDLAKKNNIPYDPGIG